MKIVNAIFFVFAFAVMAISGQAQQKEEVLASGAYQQDISKSVSVFPNPAVEYLHVKFDNPIAKRSRLTVHNIIGNILEVESEMIDEHEIRLKVKDLPVGFYLLAVRDENSNSGSTIKFLKR